MLVVTALVSLAACGGDSDEARPPQSGTGTTVPVPGGGLSLALRHPDPLRAGAPVTWTLAVRNDGPEAVTLTFSSGQRGDVVLLQAGSERYRWSRGRVFTQALAEMPLAPGEGRSFDLEDERLDVQPGQYELVASLASQPAPPPAARRVTIVG